MQPVNFDLTKSLLQNPPGTAVASAAPNTYVSEDMENLGRRGLKLTIDITNINGATVTVTIQGKDKVSGKYYTLLASAALVANGTTTLTVYPGETAAANLVANDILPATWRVSVVIATATPTLTIGGAVIQ